MQVSSRLSLPLLSPGQAQKELFHNEALQSLDLIVAAAVEELPRSDPPGSPAVGDSYLIGQTATGEWSGQENKLAAMTDGGWRYVEPVEGMQAWVRPVSAFATFVAGVWEIGVVRSTQLLAEGIQVVGPQLGSIADPAGGAVADSEARDAIESILSALRNHGLIAAN